MAEVGLAETSEVMVGSEKPFEGIVTAIIYDPVKREILLSRRKRGEAAGKLALVSGKGWPNYVDTPEEGVKDEVRVELGTGSFQTTIKKPAFIWNEGQEDEIQVYAGTVKREEIDPIRETKFSTGSVWMPIDEFRLMDEKYLAFEHVELVKKFIELLDKGEIAEGWR